MLSGSIVRLRTVREEDLDWLIAECGKPSALGEFEPFLLGAAEALRSQFDYDGLISDARTRLVIEDRSGRRIGLAFIDDLDLHARVARIAAIVLDPHERGKGFGTDAHRVLVSYLFRHRNLARIESFVGTGNIAARSVLKRLGFTEEGTLRSRTFAHGQRHDVVACGLLLEEWQERTGPSMLTR
jgi:RimJ/RimL family protein N-acetyltransferase